MERPVNIPGEIDRVSRLSVAAFRDEYFARSPVVITDVMSGWKAMDWTVEELKHRFRNAKVPMRMDTDEFDAFCDATCDLVLRESKQARALALKGNFFWIVKLDAYFDAVLRGGSLAKRLPYIMDLPLSRSVLTPYLRVLRTDAAEDWAPLFSGLESLTAQVAFPEYLAGNRDYRFWFTPGPRPRGTIHADGFHNLNAQIRGRKAWILLPPGQGPGEFSCTTSDGDLLYIPKSWWHAAAALEPCININAWHVPAP
jgi:lysine-specific demethylase 8